MSCWPRLHVKMAEFTSAYQVTSGPLGGVQDVQLTGFAASAGPDASKPNVPSNPAIVHSAAVVLRFHLFMMSLHQAEDSAAEYLLLWAKELNCRPHPRA